MTLAVVSLPSAASDHVRNPFDPHSVFGHSAHRKESAVFRSNTVGKQWKNPPIGHR